jgi:hypothetical protein
MTRTAGEAGAGEAEAAPEELGGGGLEAALLAASGAVRAASLREVRQVEAFYERRLAQLEQGERVLLGRFWRAVTTLQEYGYVRPYHLNRGECFEKCFWTLVEYSS